MVRSGHSWRRAGRRLAADPLVGIRKLNEATDRRKVRWALTDEEFRKLLDAARSSDVVAIPRRRTKKGVVVETDVKVSRPDRDWLYLVAASTGLRLGELRSLTPQSFMLEGDTQAVTVEAAYSKRRRRDVVPVPVDVATLLEAWLSTKPHGVPLWPKTDRMADVIRADLKSARVLVKTPEGEVDFHALRHTYVTRLARAGLPPIVAKELARHSTITLTMDRYAHTEQQELHGALSQVPSLVSSPDSSQDRGERDEAKDAEPVTRATSDADDSDCQWNWQYSADTDSRLVSEHGTDDDLLELFAFVRKALEEMDLDASGHTESSPDANGPARIRTWDRAIMSRLL